MSASTTNTTVSGKQSKHQELVKAVRQCFLLLTDAQFESVVLVERRRRKRVQNNNNNKWSDGGAAQKQQHDSPNSPLGIDDDDDANSIITSPSPRKRSPSASTGHFAGSTHNKKQKTSPSVAATTTAVAPVAATTTGTTAATSTKTTPSLEALSANDHRLRSAWEAKYQDLLSFRLEYGHVHVPNGDPKYRKLSGFLKYHRTQWRMGALSNERIQRLSRLGVTKEVSKQKVVVTQWTIKARARLQRDRHEAASKSDNNNNNNNSSSDNDNNDKNAIGAILNAAARELPATVGQGPGIKQGNFQDRWNFKLSQLQDFRTKFGHCNVSSTDKAYLPLYSWISSQRTKWKLHMKGEKTNLTKDQIQKLCHVGLGNLETGPTNYLLKNNSTLWQNRCDELKRFRDKHGHCNVSTSIDDQDESLIRLASWCQYQKLCYSNKVQRALDGTLSRKGIGTMTDDQQAKLEELNFDFRIRNPIHKKGKPKSASEATLPPMNKEEISIDTATPEVALLQPMDNEVSADTVVDCKGSSQA